MSKQNDGGQAFPNESDTNGCYGMTLRDWFAGQAMTGWLASMHDVDSPILDKLAEFSYDVADAMLEARDQ